MADAVGLVLGHQRRALAGDQLADPLELRELRPRSEADAAVAERVRPDDSAGDHERQGAGRDSPPRAGQPADPEHGRERDRRRSRGQRLAADPRRTHEDERCAGDEGAEHVQRRARRAAADRPGEAGGRGGAGRRDQAVARRARARGPAGNRPTARFRQPATGPAARSGCRAPSASVSGEEVGGRSAPATINGRLSRATPPPTAAARSEAAHRSDSPSEQRDASGERRQQPDQAAGAQDPEERRGGDPRRHEHPPIAGSLDRPQRQRHDRGEQRGRRHLLDPAPEVVAEEQRRLSADEGGAGAQSGRRGQRRRQRPKAERKQRPGEGDVGLDQPGGSVPSSTAPAPKGRKTPTG